MLMLKISSHPIGGFISFSPARWMLVLHNKDAQKAKSSFLSKNRMGNWWNGSLCPIVLFQGSSYQCLFQWDESCSSSPPRQRVMFK
jgi:hypothetical protein